MPSPIAHSSMALLAWRPLCASFRRPVTGVRRLALLGLLLGALVAPDLDIALDPLLGREWFEGHGGPVHSLAAGLLFGVVFAAMARALAPAPVLRLWIIGVAAYWSHVALDACTYGRGVMMLWPLTSERIGTPVPLFFGVRHGEWGAWHLHAITVGTEALFAAAVWVIVRAARRRRPARFGCGQARCGGPLEGAL